MMKQALLWLLAIMPLAASAQNITAQQDTIDLGKIAFNTPAKATFHLRNTGNTPIFIREVKTSCGCTTVDYPQKTIGKSRRFSVSAVYDAKMMGHFYKMIALYPNESRNPYILYLKGIVVAPEDAEGRKEDMLPQFTLEERMQMPLIQAGPHTLSLAKLGKKKKATYTIYIKNVGGKMLEIESVEVPAIGVRAQLSDKLVVPGKKEKLKITIYKSFLESGETDPAIIIKSNDPVIHTVVIKIK